ncbi:MFS transporter [Speluncibacter jeojiensis]|uniref:MFS transporter n=1 Tax=Speluncibacter jeojiensis TaxID=2710754 RepID=A0A9X4LXP9_9ACTN|nr:MFS transporter [Corynebacteriales bacterium D3-21]
MISSAVDTETDPDPDTERRTAVRPFRALTAAAGWSFYPVGLLARLPFAMLTLGITAYVATVRGSFADGGLAAGAYALAAAVGAAVTGAATDRFGQRRLLLVLAIINAAVVLGFVSVAGTAPLPLLVVAAAVVGATIPPVGPLARVRWAALVEDRVPPPHRARVFGTALSYESMADELTFMFGPALVGVLSALLFPSTPLLACVLIMLVFGGLFALHPTVAAAAHAGHGSGVERARLREFLLPARLLPVLGMLTIGSLFGALSTSVIAYAADNGSPSSGGIIYAGFGVGSALASLAMAAVPDRFALSLRWVVAAVCSVGCAALLPLASGAWVLAGMLALLGCAIGPVIVTLFGIGSRVAPAGRAGLQMTLLSGGIIAGNAIGAPIAGAVADSSGSSMAFLVVVASAGVLAALGFVHAVAARRRPE